MISVLSKHAYVYRGKLKGPVCRLLRIGLSSFHAETEELIVLKKINECALAFRVTVVGHLGTDNCCLRGQWVP